MAPDTRTNGSLPWIRSSDRRRTIAGVALASYMLVLSLAIVGGPLLLLTVAGVGLVAAIKLTVVGVAIGYIPVVLLALGDLPGSG